MKNYLVWFRKQSVDQKQWTKVSVDYFVWPGLNWIEFQNISMKLL